MDTAVKKLKYIVHPPKLFISAQPCVWASSERRVSNFPVLKSAHSLRQDNHHNTRGSSVSATNKICSDKSSCFAQAGLQHWIVKMIFRRSDERMRHKPRHICTRLLLPVYCNRFLRIDQDHMLHRNSRYLPPPVA